MASFLAHRRASKRAMSFSIKLNLIFSLMSFKILKDISEKIKFSLIEKDIARLDARRWAKNDAIEIKHFFERLSVALQRGNAALIINRDADINCI